VLLGVEIGQAGAGYLKRGAGHDPARDKHADSGGMNRRAGEEMVLAAGATDLTLVHAERRGSIASAWCC
jgi:hypothetical protein